MRIITWAGLIAWYFPLFAVISNASRDRLDALQDVRDRRLQPHPARRDEPDRVFQMGQRADVREEVAQAPLAQQVDVEFAAGRRTRRRR